jgi:squalene cyclase
MATLRGSDEARRKARLRYGGNGTEKAVAKALDWLSQTQLPDGSWAPDMYQGEARFKIGTTGLALLSFLAEGSTHIGGEHRDVVRKGIDWLLQQQQRAGDLAGLIGDSEGPYMYNHGVAALAIVEDYLMTNDTALAPAVDMAVSFIVQAQNAAGGWDYTFRGGKNDTSVTGWQVMCLKVAQALGHRGLSGTLRKA